MNAPAQTSALDLSTFEEARDTYDALVADAADIDRFCASSAWILSAHEAFGAGREPLVTRLDDGWIVLARTHQASLGEIWAPLEAMWLLACPIITRPTTAAMRAAALHLAEESRWDCLWLSGLREGGPLLMTLVAALRPKASLFLGPTSRRHHSLLRGGIEAWLRHRSPGFRKKARQALRASEAGGLTLEHYDATNCASRQDADALFARIFAIETRSWKGVAGSGFVDGGMKAFYARMLPRLAERGALRAIIGQIDGQDACFLFGGVFGDTFRGLQMSFEERHRPLGLGNVMQLRMIERLGAEGLTIYDLGSEMAYKERWSDHTSETVTLIARRQPTTR